MATYSTNEEVRASFPMVDTFLPHTRVKSEQDGSVTPLTTLLVDSTNNFPESGSVYLLDSLGTKTELAYSQKSPSMFYLEAATSLVYDDNTVIATSEYQLDHYRILAKAWVDMVMTNPNVPANFKKDMEIQRTFVLVTMQHENAGVREWGASIQTNLQQTINALVKQFPGVMRQTIAKLTEDNLTADQISVLKFGVRGDQ